jgi:hypothetical protein
MVSNGEEKSTTSAFDTEIDEDRPKDMVLLGMRAINKNK